MIKYGVWVSFLTKTNSEIDGLDRTSTWVDSGGFDKNSIYFSHREITRINKDGLKMGRFATDDINLAHQYCHDMINRYSRTSNVHYEVKEIEVIETDQLINNWLSNYYNKGK